VPYALWMSLAVLALLVAERRGSQAGIWAAKPLAAAAFVAAALAWGALDSLYGRIVLVGLVFCWWGDVLLIPRSQAIFRLGIASFLLGHVAFTAAFLAHGVDPTWTALAVVAAMPALAVVIRWLGPHVPADMRGAVYAYMAVITAMVACAVGLVAVGGPGLALAGAVAFYFSDLSVARDRFVAAEFTNRLWGLPLYFGAQLLFAASVALD
jgi:uncharacterized membrane protein YhhN